MKILFFTDSHGKGVNPISRRGDFFADLMVKFREIGTLGRQMGVDVYLHGGDLFDSPLVSLNVCDEVVDEIERWGKPFFIIRGNHDEIGHNPNASGQSVLDHIFRRSKVIKHLEHQVYNDGELFIQGFDYTHNIEEDIRNNGLMSSMPNLTGKKIAVVHAFILDKPFIRSVPHIVIDDIKTDFNLVLVGHYHLAFGSIKKGNTTFVGLGALMRTSVIDINRKPSVAVIDTTVGSMNIIYLNDVKPADEVFDLNKIAETKQFEDRLDDFIDSLDSVKFQGLNLRNIIEQIGKEGKVERVVIDEILERIGKFETV